MILTGLDRLLADAPAALAGRRFALLGHRASLSAGYEPAHCALLAAGARPQALFAPEHGYFGVEQDMVPSGDERDPWTGVPIRSLYGDRVESLRPRPDAFSDLDLLLVDLQDVGARYYTYAATAIWAAEAAMDAGCEVWVLDRPNPLGGRVIEGTYPDEGLDSFVGAFEIPVRHGLTLGELFALEMGRRSRSEGWRVWAMPGWSRDALWSDLGRAWPTPSPNLPTFEAAVVYPGLCLVEATSLSEGRGTTRPFTLCGGPGIDAGALVADLSARDLPGLRFLPTRFRPQFQKHAGAVCEGVELVVTDAHAVPALRLGFAVLEALWSQVGGEGFWRDEAYEFVLDRPAIDLLAGSTEPRCRLEAGESLATWVDSWSGDERRFRVEARAVWLYEEGSRP